MPFSRCRSMAHAHYANKRMRSLTLTFAPGITPAMVQQCVRDTRFAEQRGIRVCSSGGAITLCTSWGYHVNSFCPRVVLPCGSDAR